jgi:hypothetical protein
VQPKDLSRNFRQGVAELLGVGILEKKIASGSAVNATPAAHRQ